MSSYLNIYLVPKDNKETKTKPLLLISFSRSADIYSVFYENLHPAFIGTGEETNYTELTSENIAFVVDNVQKDLKEATNRLNSKIEAYKKLPQLSDRQIEDYIEDYVGAQEYIRDLQNTLTEVQTIKALIDDLKYSDFEKCLINID